MSDDHEPHTDYEIEYDTFLAESLALDRWFVWAMDNDRKIPRAPWSNPDHTDKFVSWKEREHWVDFDTADEWASKVSHFGHASCIPAYEENATERLIFFDFDDCRDAESGAIHGQAWAFIEKYDLAAFISTSGTGLHGFGWGSLPEGYKPSFDIDLPEWEHGEDAELEVYAASRFMALTGEHIVGTPVSAPDLGETAHELFEAKGNERTTGTEREPEVSREEIADVDTTTDVKDIYDAVAHTRPRDIRLRSPVTEDYSGRDANCARDPSWASSTSGTRLAEFDTHWLYRKGNHRLDALQVVALEEGIIRSETDYPSGDDFVDAVDELRDRGAHIPELVATPGAAPPPSSEDAKGARADAAATDGGAAAAEGGGTDAASGREPEEATESGLGDSWQDIREMFRETSDNDDRATPRFEAAMKLYREESFANLKENEVLYAYDDDLGIYDSDGEAVVREHLTVGLEEQYRSHTKNEVLEQIRGRTTLSKDEMGGPAWTIAAENCVIDLDAAEQRQHSPDYRFMSRLGTPFDPDADAPRFREFLKEVVPSESERLKLQEFAGYTLHHWGHPYHKALFLVGPTASGKSTFLDTINAMLGEGTTASLTPQQMTSERFAGAELFEKWANIRNDIPKATVENTGAFKEIVAGDPMKAEEKYQDPFRFEPTAKHLFAANQLPETEVDDEAFYRRILLVPFPETIPVDDRDKHLDDKLQQELPGVLNWAIQGLQRLREQGGFTADRSPGHTADTWQKWGDSVSRFASNAVTETTDNAIPKEKLYAAYLEYCRQESIPSDTQHSMTRGLKQEGFEDGRQYVNGTRKRCFLHIDLTGRGEELLDAAKNRSSDDDRDSDPGRGSALKDF